MQKPHPLLSGSNKCSMPDLTKIVAKLEKHYGYRPVIITTNPFELILLESVAYLVSDEQREKAFATLREHAGTRPHEIN